MVRKLLAWQRLRANVSVAGPGEVVVNQLRSRGSIPASVDAQDGTKVCLPLKPMKIANDEREALRLLTRMPTPESCVVAERILVRGRTFSSEMYKRRGKSSDFIIQFSKDHKQTSYGTVTKYVHDVNHQTVALVRVLHEHSDEKICTHNVAPSTDICTRDLVREGLVGTQFVPVEKLDHVVAVPCKCITGKCVFVPTPVEGVHGHITGYVVVILDDIFK